MLEALIKDNLRCTMYHGKMSAKKRTLTQNAWMTGEVDILVATVAFGMGIDKPNVRYVIHASIPKSLENYY